MEQTSVFSQAKFLDFEKAKVQPLTLDQLENTSKEDDIFGNPLKGIYHFVMLQTIIEMCAKQGLHADVWDLFAAQNRDRNTPGVTLLPKLEAQYGEKAVEAHILRRVFANIRLTDFDDAELTTNLAVAYHQQGIQVGFGNAVQICHNQCMLGANQYIATYGAGRGQNRSVQEVIETVKGWLYEAFDKVQEERRRMLRMKEVEVDADTIFRLIGMLTAMRVKCDTNIKKIKESVIYPLNQAQISRFTELLMLKYEEEKRISVWDMYNAATELYKADSMDITQMLPQNMAMSKFLVEQFPTINS